MDITKLTIFVSLILALSIASERLVEITKGFLWPSLNDKGKNKKDEQKRKAKQHILAIIAGVITTLIASWAMPDNELLQGDILPRSLRVLSIGLLVSGGSGLWNSVLTYILNIKDLKEAQLKK